MSNRGGVKGYIQIFSVANSQKDKVRIIGVN
jgi:hypothetical protein